ncbi:PTS sugar transporter subunit IIB [Lacrimispora sp. 210928-DFI.3.58]|uniref:PTS sugar transporter subunit IIB n=1 Tax=Lacrimispora sp. 210928-DFI.3.58 TaxID=2883214 RepID=UPI001D08BAF7|nr:PTS sugar transporter subunit IIB [Lacrimispora sp. 210928-DFI.3.58]MCB7319700.1 PTS sugar transporter subunit IIB [Lacrimispora sp. 210928-DFI.3.58]
MSVKMIRIDDRLIHGQIVAAWVKSLSINRIWIVDDGVAGDTFITNVMKMVAPPDAELIITGTDGIASRIKEFDTADKNTLILVKFPKVAKLIFDAGVGLKELNVGGMGANADRKKLFKNISASESELADLRAMKEMGLKVYFQVTPNEKQTLFEG